MWLAETLPSSPGSSVGPLKGAEEGDARPRRGWPPSRSGLLSSSLTAARDTGRRRCKSLEAADVGVGARGEDGRRFVPPGKRPSTSVAARKGRERPRLRIAIAAPGPTGGVAHAPRVSVGDVLGRACVSVCDIRLEITPHSHHNLHEREQEFPDICTSAPVPDFPGPLRRVKALFADAHRSRCTAQSPQGSGVGAVAALTRPARSRLVCNYRSDGRIGEFKFASRVLSSPSTNQLTACAWNAAPNFSSRRWSFVSI